MASSAHPERLASGSLPRWAVFPSESEPIETLFAPVGPAEFAAVPLGSPRRHRRAVVLVHGFRLRLWSSSVRRPRFDRWQRPGSFFVRTLAEEADVFSFAYGQNGMVDEIAHLPGLVDNVKGLRRLGYREVALVGFSAGGLVVRHFVENYPQAGVTKVIQVCAPNGGSFWARCQLAVRPNHRAFVDSLSKTNCLQRLRERRQRLPAGLQFVSVVATGLFLGDGVVSTRCQWTEDLQEQGVPAVAVRTLHGLVMYTRSGVETIAELVRRGQPRWDAAQVGVVRRQLLGA